MMVMLLYLLVGGAAYLVSRRPLGDPSVPGYVLGVIAVVAAWLLGQVGYSYFLVVCFGGALAIDMYAAIDNAKHAPRTVIQEP